MRQRRSGQLYRRVVALVSAPLIALGLLSMGMLAAQVYLSEVREHERAGRARIVAAQALSDAAQALATPGAKDSSKNDNEPSEVAAWIATCRIMLNMDEFITRN